MRNGELVRWMGLDEAARVSARWWGGIASAAARRRAASAAVSTISRPPPGSSRASAPATDLRCGPRAEHASPKPFIVRHLGWARTRVLRCPRAVERGPVARLALRHLPARGEMRQFAHAGSGSRLQRDGSCATESRAISCPLAVQACTTTPTTAARGVHGVAFPARWKP